MTSGFEMSFDEVVELWVRERGVECVGGEHDVKLYAAK